MGTVKRVKWNRKQRGQSMVEFALTSLLFIGLVVSIIEIARIMHAYITIQHAARVGARYAVTGQWMEEYSTSPSAHYNPDSGDIYARIYPCWPRFPDYDAELQTTTPDGPEYYEPYRGPRTCSIERQAVQQMRPLQLNPDAGYDQSGHYEIVVSSWSNDPTPTSGEFGRDGQTWEYVRFYNNTQDLGGVVRGYAGRPNGKVVVQIRYNIRMITPIFANIVPFIPLQARVSMTNEAFGSTSVLTEASAAPVIGEIDPLHVPIPADLQFTSARHSAGPTNPPPAPDGTGGESVAYTVKIANNGELNADQAFDLCVYASRQALDQNDLRNPATFTEDRKLGCASVPELEARMSIERTFPVVYWTQGMGKYYIYAVVDPVQAADSTDGVEGNINEKGAGSVESEARETNNWVFIEEINVGYEVDLEMSFNLDDAEDKHPTQGRTDYTYTVTLTNNGSHDINGLNDHVTVTVPPEFILISTTDPNYEAGSGNWRIPMVAGNGGSVSITFTVEVIGDKGKTTSAQASVQNLPFGYYNIDALPSVTQDFHIKD